MVGFKIEDSRHVVTMAVGSTNNQAVAILPIGVAVECVGEQAEDRWYIAEVVVGSGYWGMEMEEMVRLPAQIDVALSCEGGRHT